MSLRHFDGFDYYPAGDLTKRYNVVGGSFLVVPGAGRYGSGALQNYGSGGNESLSKFLDPQNLWITGFAYKYTPGGKPTQIVVIQDGASTQVVLQLTTEGRLQVVSGWGSVLGTGTTALLTNTFYFIEFKVAIDANGAFEVRLGGVTEITGTGNTNKNGSGTASVISLRYDHFQVISNYDDWYICDGNGSKNKDFLGDVRCEVLVPNADGHYVSETSVHGAGTSYGAVNENTEDGDTTYVYSATAGVHVTYKFPNLSSAPDDIFAIQHVNVARKDDAGNRAIASLIRINNVDYLGPDQGLADTYTYLCTIWENNPATGSAWAGTEVNQLEAGVKVTR